MTLKEAADKLRKEIGSGTLEDSFIMGLAEKGEFNPEDRIVVYWRKKVNYQLPEFYEGYRVVSRYIGKLEIKPSKEHGGGI